MYTRYAKLRDQNGLNDLKVSEATNIPASTIYDWKQRSAATPKAGLSVDKLQKLAKFFNVPIEYFLE